MTTHFPSWLLYLIPALPLLGFLINGFRSLAVSHREKGPCEKVTAIVACLMPTLAFGIAVWAFLSLVQSPHGGIIQPQPLFTWMDTSLFKVDFSLMVDNLSAVMILVVTGVGSLIHYYSTGYMHDDRGYTRYFAYLNLFLFFMILLVLGDNLLVLFVGWEGVGLCSYLLIGFWFDDPAKAAAGKKAFVVNRIGDFGFLIGLFLILQAFISSGQTGDLSFFSYAFLAQNKEILAPLATIITLCLFMGATGKSAQIPLYVWLPDAMAGPTPVSALIHAATMVTAGVYMVARLYFLFVMAPFTLDVIAGIGLATALMAALIAITQTDIKKVLAYSTVSQLGFMFLALGVGSPQAAIFHVMTHAFFKACLFLGSGSVIYALHHEQDIRHMGGLLKKLPVTGFAFLVSTMAIAGIPPLSGFFSKDEILWNTYQHAPLPVYLLALFVAGLTAFYMFRLFTVVFLGQSRSHHCEKLPKVMDVPVAILAVLAVIGGLVGVPEALGAHNYFHHWLSYLSPATASHGSDHGTELGLMGLSAVWAITISLISLALYRRNWQWTASLKSRFSGVHALLSNKFYVDEIYDFLIVKPVYWLSRNLLWKGTDQKIIDGLMVHGWTDLTQASARFLSRLQTGLLSHYLAYLWLGLFVLLVYVMRA